MFLTEGVSRSFGYRLPHQMSAPRRKRAWLGLAAVFLACLTVFVLYHRESWAQRRALRACLAGLPNYNSPPLPSGLMTNDATEALRLMGPRAVPHLVKMLNARDSHFTRRVKDSLNRVLVEQSYISLRFLSAADERRAALNGVYVLGPEAKATLPAISKVLEEGVEDWQAVLAIWRIGPEGIPILIEALTNRSASVRRSAAGLLTHFREHGDIIIPALIARLDDPAPDFRSAVPTFLASFGPAAKIAMPRLLAMAESSNANESVQAVHALISLDCDGTLRVFLKKLESSDPAVRAHYAELLRFFGPEASCAVPALTNCLRDENQAVRRAAAIALGEIGADPEVVVPALLEKLQEDDLWLRTFAAISLGSFGSQAKAAVPAILSLIGEHSTNKDYRALLLKALVRIDPDTAAKILAQ